MKKIFKKKEVIKDLLEKHPSLRDSDRGLITVVWHYELCLKYPGDDWEGHTAIWFLKEFVNGSCSHPESIRRTRQKLQEEFPHLRGEAYHRRHQEMEPEVRQEVLDFGG